MGLQGASRIIWVLQILWLMISQQQTKFLVAAACWDSNFAKDCQANFFTEVFPFIVQSASRMYPEYNLKKLQQGNTARVDQGVYTMYIYIYICIIIFERISIIPASDPQIGANWKWFLRLEIRLCPLNCCILLRCLWRFPRTKPVALCRSSFLTQVIPLRRCGGPSDAGAWVGGDAFGAYVPLHHHWFG